MILVRLFGLVALEVFKLIRGLLKWVVPVTVGGVLLILEGRSILGAAETLVAWVLF